MEKVSDIMIREVMTVSPETPIVDAVSILLKKGFSGLPVVDGTSLVGVVTQYDMITKGSTLHVPTILKLMGGLNEKDAGPIREQLKTIMQMKVKDVMNVEPLTLRDTVSVLAVVDAFSQHHKVNPIPIVDEQNNLVGIVSRSDIVKILGDPRLAFNVDDNQQLDANVDKFIQDFRGGYVLVSKSRTRWWLIASIFFALVGFVLAWAIILRIRL